ncbi:MAG: DegT/DnrJ/EryC1/StrS family aminotransferase [Candidatus Calditenuis sp.]|nr:DegT/DnrJ/EryC1/StrS family aminotransferase [Candidatus Calditenuis sp.]
MSERLAVRGGKPVRTRPFPSWPQWGDEEERNLLEVLRSGVWGIGGKKAFEFAAEFASYSGCRYGVPCANGTVALKVALRAVGVGEGDPVVTSPYTFIATASVLLELGAVPVFADLSEGGLHMDVTTVDERLELKALLPVHIAGMPNPMDEIWGISREKGIPVVEDAAQAHGSEWRGKRAGSLGTAGCFSFQSSKVMTSGEGGCITTDVEELADLCWSLVNCGRTKTADWYEHELIGYNYRMTEFQAAVLKAQLKRLDSQIERRQRNFRVLLEETSSLSSLEVMEPPEGTTRFNGYIVPIRIDRSRTDIDKRRVVEALRAEGIPSSPGYTVPLHRHPGIANYVRSKLGERALPVRLPNAEAAVRDVFWLPHVVLMGDEEDVLDVVRALAKVDAEIENL